jgi:hypothetical protein
MYANKPKMARRWEKETPEGKELPKWARRLDERQASKTDKKYS